MRSEALLLATCLISIMLILVLFAAYIRGSIVSETVMFTKVFKDNTISCCSGNIGDVFLGYLSIFIEKHVNVAHQNLPNAYNW